MPATHSYPSQLCSPVTDRDRLSPFRLLGPLDWILLAALCAVLFAIAIYRSHTRLLWADELISHQIFSDPSFPHMLRAWYKGADSGGLTYYLLCPLWLRLFGLSEVSLRLFSTAGMASALVLLWTSLRRYTSVTITAAALGIVFFTSPAILWQELNGRFYGLYFAFAALATLTTLLIVERSRPSRSLLFWLWLAHAGLVASHIFGLLFSASLVAGTWLADRVQHRTRWRVYLVPVTSWLVVLVSLPSLRASTSVVGKVFWTRKPVLLDLVYSLAGYGRGTLFLLSALLLAAGGRLLWIRLAQGTAARWPRPPLAPLTVLGSFLLATLLFFVKSQVGVSIFADRYLLPTTIASAFALAGALRLLLPTALTAPQRPLPSALAAVVILLPCCLFGATRNVNYLLYPTSPYIHDVNALLRPGVPGVAGLPVFPFLHTYDPGHQILFLTDWSYANKPAHLADYSGERLMDNWKTAGYLAPDILPCTEIFARYPQVDLLLSPHLYAWFNDRVLPAPNYRVTLVGVVHQWDWVDVYRVDRLGPGPPPC